MFKPRRLRIAAAMPRLRPYLAVALGALAGTGFAPLDWWPLTLACFAAWLWLVFDAASLRRVLWIGWLFGLGHFSVNDNWIQHAFTYQDKMPHWLGYGAPVALALYLAVYPMLAAALMWRLASPRSRGDLVTPPGAAFVLVSGAAWIAAEYLRAEIFTGYAWDPLGVVWLPVIGIARLAAFTGTYALSGLTVVAAGALMLLFHRRWLPLAVVGVGALLAAVVLAPAETRLDPAGPHVRVVQPDIDQNVRQSSDFANAGLARLMRLSGRPGPVPRLVLWPEGALEAYVENGYPARWYEGLDPAYTRQALGGLLGPRDVLMTGGDSLIFSRGEQLLAARNAIFALDARGRILGRYDKAHLVPYGEYLPMPWLLRPLGLARLVPGDLDFRPGPGPRGFTVPGFGAIGFQICYEIVFSGEVVDEAHRPRALFNPSNDAWFGTWGPPQHLAQARMRAIEEGLPILRSTPNGISAIIAADGRLLATVPRHQAGAIELPLPPALPPTLFSRAGNWMALLVAAALCLMAVALRRRAR